MFSSVESLSNFVTFPLAFQIPRNISYKSTFVTAVVINGLNQPRQFGLTHSSLNSIRCGVEVYLYCGKFEQILHWLLDFMTFITEKTGCLLNSLLEFTTKKTWKIHITGLLMRGIYRSPARNAESVYMQCCGKEIWALSQYKDRLSRSSIVKVKDFNYQDKTDSGPSYLLWDFLYWSILVKRNLDIGSGPRWQHQSFSGIDECHSH